MNKRNGLLRLASAALAAALCLTACVPAEDAVAPEEEPAVQAVEP